MMPSNILTALLFLLSLGVGEAQSHIPFSMKNSTWKHKEVTTCSGLGTAGTTTTTFNSYTGGDTIIGGESYVKIYTTQDPAVTTGTCSPLYSWKAGTWYWGAMRQSSDLSKVYLLPAGQSAESLYYDFTLSKGDTLKTIQEVWNTGPPRIVDSVYYQIFSDGICRRVYKLSDHAFFYNGYGSYYHYDEITEGIGMTTGLYHMYKSGSFYYGHVTTASTMTFEINGTPVTRATAACMRDVGLAESGAADFKVWPNPGNDLISISDPGDRNLQYSVLDMYGREILKSEIPTINAESLLPGIYFVRICYRNGLTVVNKWIKQ